MIGLGEIIQVKRKELGLTQERLAEKIGKTAGYIGQIAVSYTHLDVYKRQTLA